MVVIHIKGDDSNQFLYETTTKASNDTVIRELVRAVPSADLTPALDARRALTFPSADLARPLRPFLALSPNVRSRCGTCACEFSS